MDETNVLRVLVFGAIAFYYLYHRKTKQIPQDERERLIHLKSLEWVQNVFSWIIVLFAAVYLIDPKIESIYLLVTLSVGWFLAYPIGNMVLRHRM